VIGASRYGGVDRIANDGLQVDDHQPLAVRELVAHPGTDTCGLIDKLVGVAVEHLVARHTAAVVRELGQRHHLVVQGVVAGQVA